MSNEELKKQLEEQIAANKALTEELEGQKQSTEEARKEAEGLKNIVDKAKATGIVSKPVSGSFLAKWTSPDGQKKQRKVEFKDGRLVIILPAVETVANLRGASVTSEGLLLLANGKEPAAADIAKYPALSALDQEKAAAVLTHFAGIDAGFLK